jgi:uncharacterized PurR-regulated membrane protein YhhQ (DUF165 family)
VRRSVGALAGVVLIASVVVANYVTTRYGFIPVGFGQVATAGTFAAGFALAARDAIQDALGKRWMLAVLAVAAGLSYAVSSPAIATASLVAFAVSELLDFAVYTPIRNKSLFGDRRWAVAVALSSTVGILADTAVFLGLAFGVAAILPALLGQLIGKAWATALYLTIGAAVKACSTSRLRRVPA